MRKEKLVAVAVVAFCLAVSGCLLFAEADRERPQEETGEHPAARATPVPSAEAGQEKTVVERSERLPRPPRGTLMTTKYNPTEKEKPFFEKLSKEERTPNNDDKGYSIANKVGKYVGWFGIVRKSQEDARANQTELLVEMKYFDGMTDSHMQVVSFFGGGDFKAVLSGVEHGIKHLSLVRVYGNVVKEKEGKPEVMAEYVREWDWGLFAFMTYGKQRGNTEWQKLNKIDVSGIINDMYDAFPTTRYYIDRLGPREIERAAAKKEE